MDDKTLLLNVMMIRYNLLLERIKIVFNVSDEDMEKLRTKILNRNFIADGAEDE